MSFSRQLRAVDASMLMVMSDYLIHPLTTRGPGVHMTANGGEPLRCCLRDAVAGEGLVLFNHEALVPGSGSPYQEKGAVFTHVSTDCDGQVTTAYPKDWVGRRQVLRAYDERGWIHPSSLYYDGTDPDAAIATVLSHPEVVEVHSHNIEYGCYMFRLTRR